MILPRYSYLLAGLLPNARVTIYPDSAHGFLFQHHDRVRRRRSRQLASNIRIDAAPRMGPSNSL